MMYNPSGVMEPRPCVHIFGQADTLWRATSYLGEFGGWPDRTGFMPMHFRLTWAVDPDGPIDTSTVLAGFCWLMKIPDDQRENKSQFWWRFPLHTLALPDLADTTRWIRSDFTDDVSDAGYCTLDESWAVQDTISATQVNYGADGYRPTLPAGVTLSGATLGFGSEVRMMIYYYGVHHVYLSRIEVYDDGAYRMFAVN
jgi:hypothetical protein